MIKTSIIAFAALSAAGVARAEEPSSAPKEEARLNVVATTFPIWDWTREVLGERVKDVDLTLLQQSGADLHSYTPGAADLRKIAAADVFLFTGGESDGWTGRALAQGGKASRRVMSLVGTLGDAAKEEKMVEGMEHHHHHHEAEHDHDHEAEAEHDHHHDHHEAEHEHETDEHVWLSLRHAQTLVKAIAEELAAADGVHAALYRANAASYAAKLAELDKAYAAMAASAKRKTMLVADRFPFRYLADDYGLEHFAAFSGCSAESEASFKTIASLAKKADELALPVILTTEGAKHKIAETVKRTTKSRDQRILVLDSLQSVTGDAAEKTRYIEVMKKNLETLKEALN